MPVTTRPAITERREERADATCEPASGEERGGHGGVR